MKKIKHLITSRVSSPLLAANRNISRKYLLLQCRGLTLILFFIVFASLSGWTGTIEKVFFFSKYQIDTIGSYKTLTFPDTRLSGLPGEPTLPYHEIFLMLPPGESAESIQITGENERVIPGTFTLFPKQYAQPISGGMNHDLIRNQQVYERNGIYPLQAEGRLLTQYLNGYVFALSSFTPVRYNPASGKLSYYQKVRVRITTKIDATSEEASKNLTSSAMIREKLRTYAQNPEMILQYPIKKAPLANYQYLIISPLIFKYEFQPLINMYAKRGISVQIATTDSISGSVSGYDIQEKIRNFIKSEYQNHFIEYVLLAGNPSLVPARGFYCHVQSGGGYDDGNIPADLYYSGMDGNYDLNGNHIYAEIADAPDLLPDIAVARFTVDDTAGLHCLIHKTISYQTNPVLDELKKPLMVAEYLYNAPLTFGGPYMDLMIDNHNANGYYTHGIPSATNSIEKLYDTIISNPPLVYWSWSKAALIAKLNQGATFINHLGHANTDYMLRLSLSDITNQNFARVNGIDHNYQILYTQGCYSGAFDQGNCIAVKSVSINNFLVAGVFNSRYGWFDEGTTDGPSEHLEREFVSALYTDTLPERHLGEAHRLSKVKTAPWVTMPGEFEPGAQRWCHYCCNAFGDPALEIWTDEPTVFSALTWTGAIDNDWGKAGNWNPAYVPTSLNDIVIPDTPNKVIITTLNASFCHDLQIQAGGKLTINTGKSLIIRGSMTLSATK